MTCDRCGGHLTTVHGRDACVGCGDARSTTPALE